jgi:hypothetical protein
MATAGQKRFASLDKDEMDEIMENLDAKNTKTQTHTAVKIFREYLTEKNLPLEFEMLSDQRLDEILANFYLEIRNKSGQLYKKIYNELLSSRVLYYFYTTAKILGSYYGMVQSSSSVNILFPLSYFSSSFQ